MEELFGLFGMVEKLITEGKMTAKDLLVNFEVLIVDQDRFNRGNTLLGELVDDTFRVRTRIEIMNGCLLVSPSTWNVRPKYGDLPWTDIGNGITVKKDGYERLYSFLVRNRILRKEHKILLQLLVLEYA